MCAGEPLSLRAWKVRAFRRAFVAAGRLLYNISSYRRRMTSPLSWGCKKGRNSNGSLCVFCPFCAEIKLHVAVHTPHTRLLCVPDRLPGAMLRHLFRTFSPETPPPPTKLRALAASRCLLLGVEIGLVSLWITHRRRSMPLIICSGKMPPDELFTYEAWHFAKHTKITHFILKEIMNFKY